MLNWMPTPLNSPWRGSSNSLVSFASVYDEWGSRLSSMPLMASSMSLSSLTVSTYRVLMAYSALSSFCIAWGNERCAVVVSEMAKHNGKANSIFFILGFGFIY